MATVTTEQLHHLLLNHKGCTPVSVITQTPVKMNKKHRETKEPNPFLNRVTRLVHRIGMVGANYENSVNRKLERQAVEKGIEEIDTFHAESLWNGKGEHINNALVRHKENGTLYIVLRPTQDDCGKVKTIESSTLLDGSRHIDDSILTPYLPPSSDTPEDRVAWRVIKLENVVQLRMNGEIYCVENKAAEAA